MKKKLYKLLSLLIILSSCEKEDISPNNTDNNNVNTFSVYDSLDGFWNLSHYDFGNGVLPADTGQYIHFLDDSELSVNVQITGWTWYGIFNYNATSDSLNLINQNIAIVNLDNQNLTLCRQSFVFDYYLYFEK